MKCTKYYCGYEKYIMVSIKILLLWNTREMNYFVSSAFGVSAFLGNALLTWANTSV